jgi:hypothetical protein
VTLLLDHAASELLLAAKRLRRADDPYVASHVFVNRYLTPEEAKAAFLKRQQRRQSEAHSYAAEFTPLVPTEVGLTAFLLLYCLRKNCNCKAVFNRQVCMSL